MSRHRKDWNFVTLPEISTVFTDGPFGSNLKSSHYTDQGVRVIRLQNIGVGKMIDSDVTFISREHYESLPRNHCKPGDVIIGTLGDPNLRACIIPPEMPEALNKADCLLLRLEESQADRNYICAALNNESTVKRAMGLVRGQTRGRISMGRLKELRIPLPPLAEQKRIAGILDAADALRARRREALAQLDTLLQSTFLNMFGDPAKAGWPTETVDEIALQRKGSIRTGPFGSQLLHSEFVAEGIRVLGIDNAVANEFREGERRFITPEKYQQLKRYTVRPGDVLITIMGTCGRCAVVPHEIGTAINTKHLCCITLDPEKCIPTFLHAYFLRHPTARTYLERSAKGAIMSGLNMGIIKRLPIPLPPLDLQRRFAAIVESVERQKARMRSYLAELDALFASLQSRAFNGEL